MNDLLPVLSRIAEALERINPPEARRHALEGNAFVWSAEQKDLTPVKHVSRVELDLLKGVEQQRDTLLANTQQFAKGLPANNALLWGARGTGKSSLIKAIHQTVQKEFKNLALVEINREDIPTLPLLLRYLKDQSQRFILFCDDLSFGTEESHYKSLKAVLEGGLEGRPSNVIFYATSNRRHLMPREMIENEKSTAIHPGEAVEEKVSLSDRFGLWLGFHPVDQETYLAMIDGYATWLKMKPATLHQPALEWAMTRGGRSGRVAWQFMQDAAGKAGVKLPN